MSNATGEIVLSFREAAYFRNPVFAEFDFGIREMMTKLITFNLGLEQIKDDDITDPGV